jgi:hypothetical protein
MGLAEKWGPTAAEQKQAVAGDYEVVIRVNPLLTQAQMERSISPLGLTPDRVAQIGKEVEGKTQKYALGLAERINSVTGARTRVARTGLVLLAVEGHSLIFRQEFSVTTSKEVTPEQVADAADQVKRIYGIWVDVKRLTD